MNRFTAVYLVCSVFLGPAVFGDVGKEVFTANCASCHGTDGRARTPAGRKLHAKDLTESKLTDGEIRKQVIEGRKGQQGAVMPPFRDVLKPDQIDAVIVFVKSLRK